MKRDIIKIIRGFIKDYDKGYISKTELPNAIYVAIANYVHSKTPDYKRKI